MNKDYVLPSSLHTLAKTDLNTAFVCHSKLFGKEIAGVIVVTNNEILNGIGLIKNQGKQPNYKLRMLHDKTFEFSPFYLFEFHAKFDDGIEVNVHLNPREKAFRNLCNCAIKSKMLSLHFYNLDSVITISICVELDEEIEWFERNLEISKKIRSNSLFKSLSDCAIKQNSNDKNFYFFQNKKIKFAGF